MTIHITFNDNTVTVKTHPEDSTLYCLNDLHKASGGEKKHQPNHFRKYAKSRKFGTLITTLKGRNGGTYTDEKTVYKYAAWIDDNFYDAVFDCFRAAANGDSLKASQIANSVAIPQALIDATKETLEKFRNCILKLETQGRIKLKRNGVSLFLNLAASTATGWNCKQLTGKGCSVVDYMVKDGHQSALTAFKAAMERIGQELKSGEYDYQMIAAKLGKKTPKNKDLIESLTL